MIQINLLRPTATGIGFIAQGMALIELYLEIIMGPEIRRWIDIILREQEGKK